MSAEEKMPGLTKTQVKQVRVTEWAVANGWRPDPNFRINPQLFGFDEEKGVRIRIRFFERSMTLEEKVPLSKEEKKERPLQNMQWVVVEKRSYPKVTIKNGELDWGRVEKKKDKEEE